MKRPLVYKVTGKSLTAVLLTVILIAPIISVAGQQVNPALAVNPETNTANPGDSFTIDVNVTDVVGLFGYEFKLGFDPDVLTATNVTVGPFFQTYYLWKNEINSTAGYTWLIITQPIGATKGVDGSGTLATISFSVVKEGQCILDLYDTVFSDINAVKMTHDVYDGHFQTGSLPPVPSFTYSPSAPAMDTEVVFNASASYDPDGDIVEYEWDFGDGTAIVTVTDPIVTHVYGIAHTYLVKLKVTDNNGLTATSTAELEVSKIPVHDLSIVRVTADPKTANPGTKVTIEVVVKNNGVFTETFNITVSHDGEIIETLTDLSLIPDKSTLPPPEFTWDTTGLEPGTYTIKVEVPLHPEETATDDNTITIEVTIQESSPIVLYAVAGVAIIGIASVIVYLSKIRKSKPE